MALNSNIGLEIQKLAPSAIIDLYELDATELTSSTTSLPGELIRFHAGTNGLEQTVVWQGNSYTAFPIEVTGFEMTNKGTIPKPTLRVANINSAISTLLYQFGDLIGAKVTRKRTFAKFLDAVNFSGGVNPSANSNAHFPDEVFFISRKARENPIFVELEMSPLWDLHGIKLPRRMCIQNVCAWKYKGRECGYNNIPVYAAQGLAYTAVVKSKNQLFNLPDIGSDGKEITGAIQVTVTATTHGLSTGMSAYIDFGTGYTAASAAYNINYVDLNRFYFYITSNASIPFPSGTVKVTNRFDISDTPIYTTLVNDSCSKRLEGCKRRWGPEQILPYGGFPGVGWVR